MNFVYQNYLLGLLAFLVLYFFFLVRQENKFFSYVERFWFRKKSWFFQLSRLLFILGVALLALSVLDLRGPEERIKATVPSKRTIILMDTSASMLAEDVRPSRLEKAVLLAKHFARKAVGHQISVIAFSEIQKKIVPFTADIDLIDSRLESIRGLKNQYGSSALSLAIQEAIQYFKDTENNANGNILVLTDGEETSEGIDLKIPEGIHIAFIGIGTKNGGRIPLDDKSGIRFGYKHYKGKDVITKLNDEFFDAIVKKYPNTKYWTADTYSLPSDEVVAFFNSEFEKGVENQDMVIKPVLMEWLVLPGILLICLSYFFKMIRVFAIIAILIINPAWSQDKAPEKVMPPHVMQGLDELRQGNLDLQDKLGLAYELQKNDFNQEALTLYEEEKGKLNNEQLFNYGTALLNNKDYSKGFHEYKQLLEDKNLDENLRMKIAQNTLLFLHNKQQEDQKKSKEQKKNKNQSQDNSNSQSKDQSGQGEKSPEQQNKNDNSDEDQENDQNQDQKSDQGDKNKDEKDKDKDKEKDSDSDPSNQPKPPQKVPAKLKQLMSDDRKLQMEMIERGTKDMNKRKSNSGKDW